MWTDERTEQLKSLWTEGLSASQIARVLGGGATRNAVIGKVHRLGLAGRSTQPRAERPRVPSAPRLYRVRVPELPVEEEPPVLLEDGSHIGVMAVNDRMCRWPIGDPAEESFHFCGHPPKPDSSYCPAHTQKAHSPSAYIPKRRATSGSW